MIFDRMLSFFENTSIAKTKNAATAGRAVDFRLNGPDIDGNLNIFIGAVGTPPMVDSSTVAVVTTTIETSATGADNTWTTIATQSSDGNVLFKGRMPTNTKRFVRAKITNPKGAGDSGTDLATAYVVKGGIVCGELEHDDPVALQSFPPLADTAASTVMTKI